MIALYFGFSVSDLMQWAKFCTKQYISLLCLWEINSPKLSYIIDTNIMKVRIACAFNDTSAVSWFVMKIINIIKPKKVS